MAQEPETSEHFRKAYAVYLLNRDHSEALETFVNIPIEDGLLTFAEFLGFPSKEKTPETKTGALDDLFADVQAEMEKPKEKTIMYLDDIQTASEDKMLGYIAKTSSDPQAVRERMREYRNDPQLIIDYGLNRDKKDIKLIRAMYVAILELSGEVEILRKYKKENSGIASLAEVRTTKNSLLPEALTDVDAI